MTNLKWNTWEDACALDFQGAGGAHTNSESVGEDTCNDRLCLLYPDGVEDLQDLRDGYVDSQGLNHWHTVSWDPGVADSRVLSVCYDCLCLMALFRAVMSLAHDWVEVFVSKYLDWALCLVWTRTIAPDSVRVCAELRWGSFPQKDLSHADWMPSLCEWFGKLL